MHQSAMFHAQRFFETYCPLALDPGFTVVEIGSQNVNGSLRDVCPTGATYLGLDFVEGDGVDVVMSDPYSIPLSSGGADVIVSSSCFEHSQFICLVFLEAMRVFKPHGLLYLNAPSNGFFHQWPVDCWRFYPDAGHAMAAWAQRNGYSTQLLESFIGQRSSGTVAQGGMWNDFVAVFVQDAVHRDRFPKRILHSLGDYSNGYLSGMEGVLRPSERGPDFALIETHREQLASMAVKISDVERQVQDSRQQLVKTRTQNEPSVCNATTPYRRSSACPHQVRGA